MDSDRAKDLTAGCIRTVFAVMAGDDYIPLPEASLAELLEAHEIVSGLPRERTENGTWKLRTHCDPRVIALHYAFENYGRSLYTMANQLGYEIAVQVE